MLLAGMGLLMAVVCCNIASLLVVRASARQREIALRLSLGASRRRLVSQLVLETLPLALTGGALGLVVAAWTTATLVRGIPEWDNYVDILSFSPGPAVLVFVGALTIGCGIAFAAYPALRATQRRLGHALRVDARASRSRQQQTMARGVVVAQMALTMVLVTAASLLAVTLRNLGRVDGGFATDRVLLMSLDARGTSYEQRGMAPLHDEILASLRGVPLVPRDGTRRYAHAGPHRRCRRGREVLRSSRRARTAGVRAAGPDNRNVEQSADRAAHRR